DRRARDAGRIDFGGIHAPAVRSFSVGRGRGAARGRDLRPAAHPRADIRRAAIFPASRTTECLMAIVTALKKTDILPAAANPAARGRVNIETVSVVFGQGESSHLAVDRAQLEIPAGQFVCLLGPSGCG